jgi:hypothetical protein
MSGAGASLSEHQRRTIKHTFELPMCSQPRAGARHLLDSYFTKNNDAT